MSSSNSPTVAEILAGLGITALAGEIVLEGVRAVSTSVGVPAKIQTLIVIDTGAIGQTTATATLTSVNNPLTLGSVEGSVSRSADGKTVTIAGTLDQINADLAKLSYTSQSAVNDTVTLAVIDAAGNSKSASFDVSVLPSQTLPGAPTSGSYVQPTAYGQNATLSGGNQIYTADNKTDVVTATNTPSSVVGGGAGSSLTLTQDGGSYSFANKGGSALVVANAAPGTIQGGSSGSKLVAFLGTQASTYMGGVGTDELIGGGGNMTITGGNGGSLTVFGGAGRLDFRGGHNDHETVVGGSGAETIHAAATGGDYFGGTGGSQMFATGAGTFLIGAVGGDVLTTSPIGGDGLVAGAGNETLNASGSAYENVLFGGSGNDLVMLGAGRDTYVGGAGSATIEVGHGSAAMFIGAGASLFSFDAGRTGGGSDYIGGFRVGIDHLRLSGGLTVTAFASQGGAGGGSTALQLSDGTRVQIAGVSGASQASLFG